MYVRNSSWIYLRANFWYVHYHSHTEYHSHRSMSFPFDGLLIYDPPLIVHCISGNTKVVKVYECSVIYFTYDVFS